MTKANEWSVCQRTNCWIPDGELYWQWLVVCLCATKYFTDKREPGKESFLSHHQINSIWKQRHMLLKESQRNKKYRVRNFTEIYLSRGEAHNEWSDIINGHHKASNLTQQKFILLNCEWRLGCQEYGAPSQGSRTESFLVFSWFVWWSSTVDIQCLLPSLSGYPAVVHVSPDLLLLPDTDTVAETGRLFNH